MSNKHTIIKLRRGTAAEWAASEPQPGGEILKLGEPGYEKDTKKLKIGDGITPWNSLPYIGGDGGDIVINPEDIQDIIGNGFLVSGSGINISYNDNLNSLTISTSGVSFVGHNHVASDITNFNSSVSGLLPTISNSGDNRLLTSTGTSTGINAESNITFDGNRLNVVGSISVDNLILDNNTISSSSGNIIISPSGNGALQRDGGGDPRGTYAVDWQLIRASGNMVASGDGSVIGGGSDNTSSSPRSTVGGGMNNTSSGWYSTISGGKNNITSGERDTATNRAQYGRSTVGGGSNNTASGNYSVVGGGAQNSASKTYSAITGGKNNTASGQYSVINGGRDNVATNWFSAVGGGNNNTASGSDPTLSFCGRATVGGGDNNSATANFSTIGGGLNNTASGGGGTIGGGGVNTAAAECATVGGGSFNTASGWYSTVGGGTNNTASGNYSVVGGGSFNVAAGTGSAVSGGFNNTASGYYSSVNGGLNAVADRFGMEANSAGSFANNGDAQRVDFVLRNITSSNTATTLFLDGSSIQLTIPSGKALFATINIAGIINGGSKAVHCIRKVAIKNEDGTTSLIGTVSTLGTDIKDDIAYDVEITADNSNSALQINVTGKDEETIRWVAHVEGVEISYG